MTLPRNQYVNESEPGVYHCFCRCVRRAFLCGYDTSSNRDLSHRKDWLVDRLHHLAGIFAIEVCAYAIMANHYHTLLRTRPDIAARWSDREVAERWLMLFPSRETGSPPSELQILALVNFPERIAQLRRRLSSLSWFMARLNESVARAANKEDNVKGRFWESRFKCQALLDDAALLACMVYVDLNPVRASIARTPEDSDFTSIQQRIRAWHNPVAPNQNVRNGFIDKGLENSLKISNSSVSAGWLCPIQSDGYACGLLQMNEGEYIDLVDRSSCMLKLRKRGAVDADLEPVLRRFGVNPDVWIETVARFGSGFRLVAGLVSNLRTFADRLGRRWVVGIGMARVAFA
jgi:REP element-mobilizing transposase RayT